MPEVTAYRSRDPFLEVGQHNNITNKEYQNKTIHSAHICRQNSFDVFDGRYPYSFNNLSLECTMA